jgi:hypothetical protein
MVLEDKVVTKQCVDCDEWFPSFEDSQYLRCEQCWEIHYGVGKKTMGVDRG